MAENHEKIAVLGAGSWGTALAKLLSDKGLEVKLWAHNPEHLDAIARDGENNRYLAGFPLGLNLQTVPELDEAVAGAGVIVMAVPSHVTRALFRQVAPLMKEDAIVISASKGIENDTLLTMTQVFLEELRQAGRYGRPAVLSGPSFAKEVAAGIPTAVTVAAQDKETARMIQTTFATDFFRVYTSSDRIGLELGGALKNPIAIAAGISDGLGYGTNTRAALITRGLAEITRLGVKMGASPLTFSGLGGMGDLVLTCTGELSRNRTVGFNLGQGRSLAEILAKMEMVAEGVKTTKSAWNLARLQGVEMPILEQMYQVLYDNKSCAVAVRSLLSRSPKGEDEFS
ncbi:MAG: NAD(P)H-dependent glycerol-3-phosphate dehydrogenase [Thermodesulfobacteriota bacterium]